MNVPEFCPNCTASLWPGVFGRYCTPCSLSFQYFYPADNKAFGIRLKDDKTIYTWNIVDQSLTCNNLIYDDKNRILLPYFEPDLTNLPELIKKLKTYMVLA